MRQILLSYFNRLDSSRSTIDSRALGVFVQDILKAREGMKRVHIFGNGGSAATANHAANDWMLGSGLRNPPLRCVSLAESTSQVTALGNDVSFDEIASRQLSVLANPGDVLLTISASGSSPNLLHAVSTAHQMGVFCHSFSGFDGGELSKLPYVNSIVAHSPHGDYSVPEDLHLSLVHIVKEILVEIARREV